MRQAELADALDGLLRLRNRSYSASSRFVEDLGFDSYELVSLMLEIEAILDIEMDEAMLVFFAESTMGEVCARLAD